MFNLFDLEAAKVDHAYCVNSNGFEYLPITMEDGTVSKNTRKGIDTMKYYGNKKTGKLVPAKMIFGLGNFLDRFDYEDFTGKGQYETQVYYVLRKREREQYSFIKTKSFKKVLQYKSMGWELIKDIDTNSVSKEFLESERGGGKCLIKN